MPKTVLCLVIDGVGIKTLEYLLDNSQIDIQLTNFSNLGLGNLLHPRFHNRVSKNPDAQFAHSITQASASADSTIGHREICGIIDPNEYNLFHEGFPELYISELEKRIKRKTLFNQMAGGIEAIELNHSKHASTGYPIVYASKCDPLIQIATCEDTITVKEAHEIAETAFDLAREQGIPITRSIARTYIVRNGEVIRTANRHDVVLPLYQQTLIDVLDKNEVYTISIGKPAELVPGPWSEDLKLTRELNSQHIIQVIGPKETNPITILEAIEQLKKSRTQPTFIFANCVDTDSVYGHTQNVNGGLRSIQQTDYNLPLLFKHLNQRDLLIVTADHGIEHKGDYGYHSIEPLPFLAIRRGKPLTSKPKSNKTLASVGYLIAKTFGLANDYTNACELGTILSN